MNVLVLGGSGVISRAIVNLLLEKKHAVSVFNRGSRTLAYDGEVRQITGDRLDREDFESRMRRESFDAVIDMICFNEADARSTVAAFKDNTGQIIVCSSVAAYKRPYRSVPTVESAESLFADPSFEYAWNKAQVERYLGREFRSSQLPVTIIRPSLTYGPGAANVGVLRQNYGIIERIRKGKPLVMFGDGSTPWSFTFAPDLAKAFVGVIGNPQTFGQAYHACSEERCRWEDLYLEFGRVLGIEPRIVHISSELLVAANPELFTHLYREKTFPGLFDNAKIRSVIPDFSCDMSLHDGITMMVAWFEKEANQIDPAKESLEDRLVERYLGWKEQMRALSATT